MAAPIAIHKPELTFSDKEQTILRFGVGGNRFNLSSLSDFHMPVDACGFAIKFVTEGAEHYTVNDQRYTVSAGSYLLLNGDMTASVEIGSRQNVKGICINISDSLIKDVLATMIRPDAPQADPGLADFFYTRHFLENQYQAAFTRLGNSLLRLSHHVCSRTLVADDIHTGLFLQLAECLAADQAAVFRQLQSLRAVKPATRRDLCRRLLRGREFIDAGYTQPLSIARIAQEAALSEYHFFRLFRQMFGLSPHRYMLSRRLQLAASLLSRRDLPVTAVAFECGFADIYSFSKAFRRHFGCAPSAFAASE